MADRLTQLQDALDDLATQFYASLRYLSVHHSPPHPNPPDSTNNPSNPSANPQPPPPDDPATFAAAQRELARDLVLKEQQIEYLISVLPGIGTSEREQTERLRVLERELREAEVERRKAVEERDRVVERLDEVIKGVRRVY